MKYIVSLLSLLKMYCNFFFFLLLPTCFVLSFLLPSSVLQISTAVMSMANLYFPPSAGVSIIAEPGGFFVSSAFTLAINIISKEVVARDFQDQTHGEWHDVHFNCCRKDVSCKVNLTANQLIKTNRNMKQHKTLFIIQPISF